ncbi:DUF5634 family protein [Bacillus sp. T3]|uniref:DUF5634 family protein n=1 Tax=Bacillus sp. T3 TaxID=467262 RepID=UPI0029811E19|nr:DUF5634 family protein [Bacillus sp. T3]
MEYLSREQIINQLQQSFQPYLQQFGLDDIGVFEEHGQGNQYYIGYSAKKGDKTYHIHTPFMKNNNGELAPLNQNWTVETDEPDRKDHGGYQNVESALRDI